MKTRLERIFIYENKTRENIHIWKQDWREYSYMKTRLERIFIYENKARENIHMWKRREKKEILFLIQKNCRRIFEKHIIFRVPCQVNKDEYDIIIL